MDSSIEIIPAILPKKFGDIEPQLERLEGAAALVQVDLVGTNVLRGHDAFPHWEDFDFECDVMLPDPASEMELCLAAGASRIIVHAAAQTAREALLFLQDMRGGSFAVEVGLALRSHDTLAALEPFEGLFDYIQVMGIDHEGRQGEPPDPHGRELILVAQLREQFPALSIQVDGAAAAHVRELVAAGANRLVVGSGIFSAADPRAAYKALYTEANGAQ